METLGGAAARFPIEKIELARSTVVLSLMLMVGGTLMGFISLATKLIIANGIDAIY